MGLLDFLRDVGKHARVGTMLSRDSVRSRMELDNEGMSYTECGAAPSGHMHVMQCPTPSEEPHPPDTCM